MSSFIAHSIVGFTIGSQRSKETLRERIAISFFFIVLASTPDIDYLINYLRGESMAIRYTHSVGYVFMAILIFIHFQMIPLCPLWASYLVLVG